MQLCEEKLVFVEERKRWVTYFSLAREEEEEVRHTRRVLRDRRWRWACVRSGGHDELQPGKILDTRGLGPR